MVTIPHHLGQPLGGSGVVISRVLSPLIGLITIVTLLITPRITTHEPRSWPGLWELSCTWRFMGMVRRGLTSPLMGVISIVSLLITPLRTAHEPPSIVHLWTKPGCGQGLQQSL